MNISISLNYIHYTGPFTVLAPTDAAFAKLPPGTVENLLKDIPKLSSILTYHVISGTVLAETVLTLDNKFVKTVNGAEIKVNVDKEGVTLDGLAKVITTDIKCDNGSLLLFISFNLILSNHLLTQGVIHVIDSVLLPKSAGQDDDATRRQVLKTKLFALAATVDRGFGAKKKERDIIMSYVDELKSLSPTAIPTNGLAPAFTPGIPALLEGAWKMAYTTALDVLSLSASPLTSLQAIYQVIKSDGSSLNIIDLAPRFQALFPVDLVKAGSTLRLQVNTLARTRSATRVVKYLNLLLLNV